jgi:hypothetical protein
MSAVPTLRTYTLTDLEAEILFTCLDSVAHNADTLQLTDETLIQVVSLRDRFHPGQEER